VIYLIAIKQHMKKFQIPCHWEVYGYLTIEADSLHEAIEIAEKTKVSDYQKKVPTYKVRS
jgi:hypothetical protein